MMRETLLVTASDGVTLSAHRLGAGLPLFAIHGGPATDHTSFGSYLDPVAAYRELYLLDQRGCGGSGDSAPEGYSVERLALDIEEVRAHLAHEQVDVLGYSFGCIPALAFAVGWPQRVRALLLADGSTRGWRGILAAPASWWLWAKTVWIGMTKGGDSTEFHLAHDVANPQKRSEIRELLASPGRFDPARVGRLSMAGARPRDLRPVLAAGVRVLGIFGKQDRRFVGEAGYMSSLGANVVLIEGAGHFPFVEQHEEFHHALGTFLSGPEGRS